MTTQSNLTIQLLQNCPKPKEKNSKKKIKKLLKRKKLSLLPIILSLKSKTQPKLNLTKKPKTKNPKNQKYKPKIPKRIKTKRVESHLMQLLLWPRKN